MKTILILLIIIFSIINVSAGTIIYGTGGESWNNGTMENTTLRIGNSNEYLIFDSELKDDGAVNHIWNFENGSGTVVYNEISSSDNLTLTNTLAWNNQNTIFGAYDMYCNGFYHAHKSDVDVVPNIPNNGTLELWFMPSEEINSTTTLRELFDWNSINIKFAASNGIIQGTVYDGALVYVYTSQNVWNADEIYKLTLTWGSSGNATLKINENIVDTNTNYDGTIGDVTHRLGVGGDRSSGETTSFNGTIGDVRISNIERTNTYMYSSLGNISFNHSFPTGNELSTISINYSDNNVISVDIYASTDNITWVLKNSSHPSNITLDVSGNLYKYSRYKINSTNTSETVVLHNVTVTYSASSVSPSITSSSPSTPTTSFVNESKTFNAGSGQLGNWTWYIDSVLLKNSETNTANATYTNSTAPNGTYNVTAIITNTNGSAQTSWNWTTYLNYITTNVTYLDGTNDTIVCIFNVSYVSPGTTQWGFNFSWTDSGQQYDWTYTNGTVIQSLTASSTNETLEFMKTPPEPTGIYYIQKSSDTIETFIVAAGAFATIVVAGAAVVSRRVRVGIGGWINRRRRRR